MSRLSKHRVLVAAGFLAALGVASTVASQRTAAAMATAADRFVASLSPEQRQRATLAFTDADRTRFNFIPTEMFPRQGLMIKDMNPAQRAAAHELLKAGLSQIGYRTADEIMRLEAVLRIIESPNNRLDRDPEKYFFTVFGTPSPQGAWGYRVEGHHVSLHFTIVDGTTVANTPTFFGANPAEVREGPQKGTRILAAQEDAARALLMALDASQRATAVMSREAPRDIATGNETKVDPLAPAGIKASSLNPGQRDLLMKLVDVYVSYMAEDLADRRTAKLRAAGIEHIAFAWAGEAERGKRHYYRVQGPTFLIEYDNTQNDGNHIHSIWRDFDGDFGRDLLREHLQAYAH